MLLPVAESLPVERSAGVIEGRSLPLLPYLIKRQRLPQLIDKPDVFVLHQRKSVLVPTKSKINEYF